MMNITEEENMNAIWMNEVLMFQPMMEKQILLPDKADCLSLEAFLRMCNLNYKIIHTKNVEDMSPSGKIPLLKISTVLLSELHTIVQFAEQGGQSLSNSLQEWEKTELQSYISLINMVLVNAENFAIWVDKENFNEQTKMRYGSVYPWPLSWVLLRRKRDKVLKKLNALGWQDGKTIKEVCEDVELCCRVLSERLAGDYFFGDKPTELDAIVFAHVYTIITTYLPNNWLGRVIRLYPKIINHCQRIAAEFFPELDLCNFQENLNLGLIMYW